MSSRSYLLILVLACLPVAADQVYTYDFQSLPDGWTADLQWSFGPTGAEASTGATGGPPVSNYADLESDSTEIILPAGTDSLRVQVEEDHSLSGYYTTGEASAYVCVNTYRNGDFYSVFWDSQSWGFPDCGPNGTSSVSFPASEGDVISFRLTVSAFACGGHAQAMLHVYSMTVTAYGSTPVSRSTWGAIKAL